MMTTPDIERVARRLFERHYYPNMVSWDMQPSLTKKHWFGLARAVLINQLKAERDQLKAECEDLRAELVDLYGSKGDLADKCEKVVAELVTGLAYAKQELVRLNYNLNLTPGHPQWKTGTSGDAIDKAAKLITKHAASEADDG